MKRVPLYSPGDVFLTIDLVKAIADNGRQKEGQIQ